MLPDDPRHGTARGYSAHRRENEEPCEPCRGAAADYERQRFYDAHLGRNRLVDVTGSRRRIQALQAIGWPAQIICAELGYTHRDALAPLLYDAKWITRTRAAKIADVYARLCMTPGPSRITKSRALKAGHFPPLVWNDIDDPNERPELDAADGDDFDPVVVDRILAGDWRLKATPAERAEVVARWPRSRNELARLTGWKVERYDGSEGAA